MSRRIEGWPVAFYQQYRQFDLMHPPNPLPAPSTSWAGLPIALCFGFIAFWGSENLFWSAPTDAFSLVEVLMTVAAYSLVVAAVLGAVIWSGLGGWRALFLGGALLGWLVEGVIVGTAYEAFPFQLIWTPLAWHAAITGLVLGGICRAGPQWRLWWHLLALLAFGLFGAGFAQLWPLERGTMPDIAAVVVYLVGVGLLIPVCNLLLDRQRLPVTPSWLHKGAAAVLAVIWVVQLVFAPTILRLSVPILIGVTLWTMQRLGQRGQALPVPLGGPPAPVWRHALFLIAPVVTSFGAVAGWENIGGMEIWPIALLTSAFGGGMWLWLVGSAVWRKR